MIKRLKASYALYNYFQKDKLKHNLPLYEQYGLDKKYYSSISSKDFEHIDTKSLPKRGRHTKLDDIPFYSIQNKKTQKSISTFDKNGFCRVDKFLTPDQVEKTNQIIDQLRRSGELRFKYGNKLMFAIHKSDYLLDIAQNNSLKRLLDYLIQGDAQIFQSINFIKGSEQHTHSDSIHMTTFPLGGLLGVWIALEDIDDKNGPIHYYPGSHKLPYYMNKDYDNEGNWLFLGDKGYTAYELMMHDKIVEMDLPKKVFNGKAGDMFIWHANLLHGGEPQKDQNRTRKSMVYHYFDKKRICYHEITQRPALMHMMEKGK